MSPEAVVALITGLIGLIPTAVAAFFAIKNLISSLKNKNKSELWEMIKTVAQAAMKEAEKSGKSGADKKAQVIDAVKAACVAAGADISPFIDQLSAFIDQIIGFANDIHGKK